jgi:NADH dehydrogenase
VGGGATGVEMAGAFAEIARHSLVRDFRNIDPSSSRILLLEGGPRLLTAYHDELSAYAGRTLRRIGVEVRTGAVVTRIEPDAVYVGDERIPTRNVVWAAGVTASPLGKALGVETDRVGRVSVSPDLSVPGHPEVFVIGDLAVLAGKDGKPLPGVAPVATQQGRQVARNIGRDQNGEPRRPFSYWDKGSMATIGRRAAVMQAGKVKFKGWMAWMAWLFIHIFFLIGFRNRVMVMVQWAWSYLTWQRGSRLITGEVGPELAPRGLPLGSAAPEHPAEAEARKVEEAGTGSPSDSEQQGWMSADRDQAGAGAG